MSAGAPAPKALTPKEYATRRGCSASFVRRLKRNGRLVLTADGLIDAPASDAKIRREEDATRGGRLASAAELDSVRGVQREKLEQEVVRLRMDNLAAAKRTANRAKVERALFALTRQCIARLQALPDRLSESLAKEEDPAKVEALLSNAIAQFCQDMQSEARLLRDRGLDA